MTDLPNSPAKPENLDVKGDKDDAKDGVALPKNQQLTTTQKVFIWSMVVFVGILFGAGPITDQLLGQAGQSAYVNNVSEIDIIARQGVARRLQDALNPQRHPYFGGEMFEPSANDRYQRPVNVQEIWAERIKLARYAEAQGLLPGGAALDALVKTFLNKPMPGNAAKRYADVLEELKGGPKEVTLAHIKMYLAEERARQLVGMANVVAPAVPVATGNMINALAAMTRADQTQGKKGDQVVVNEIILTAKHLLADIKDDDAEIQQQYESMKKDGYFTRLLALEVTVAYADKTALAAQALITDSDIEAYYNANKENYRKPVEPPKVEEKKPEEKTADAAKPEEKKAEEKKAEEIKPEEKKPDAPVIAYKSLAEVSADIKMKLAMDRANSLAPELVKKFSGKAEDLLNQSDNTEFKAAAAKAGLLTREKQFIDEPRGSGTLDAGDFGMLDEKQLHLFTQEKGFITLAVQSTGEKATWLVVRVDGRRDAGSLELTAVHDLTTGATVKAKVKAVLAGKRAYKELLAKAEEIRAASEKLGPGGLQKWAASEEAKKWAVTPSTNTLYAMTQITPPAPEQGATALSEGKLLASMAMPERIVALGDSPSQGDVPAVRLVQVIDYQPAAKANGQMLIDHANVYREMLEGYRYSMFQRELRAEMEKN